MRDNCRASEGLIEAQEDLVIDAQFLLHDLMVEQGVTRAELARRVGISKARLSQVFSPKANPTLRSLAELFHELGQTVTIERGCAATQRKFDQCWTEARAVREAPVRTLSPRDASAVFSAYARVPRVTFAEPANDAWAPNQIDCEIAA
jgi:transcriptional regulator with XRE-family HTH domain